MIKRQDLVSYLHQFLSCADFNDYAPNGLQVEGSADIRRICSAVTASSQAIEEAVKFKSDALLVHHGYFWRGENPVIVGMKRSRIAQLIAHNINLLAYHLPLDCHLELGNNARLGELLDLDNILAHKARGTSNLLWSGEFPESCLASDIAVILTKKLNRRPLLIGETAKPIKTIAWCSGGAQDYIEEAHALGVDAYLSGEVSERTFYQAQELGIHYFAAGHHATERLGIQALGQHLATRFNLQHHFIDSDNPV